MLCCWLWPLLLLLRALQSRMVCAGVGACSDALCRGVAQPAGAPVKTGAQGGSVRQRAACKESLKHPVYKGRLAGSTCCAQYWYPVPCCVGSPGCKGRDSRRWSLPFAVQQRNSQVFVRPMARMLGALSCACMVGVVDRACERCQLKVELKQLDPPARVTSVVRLRDKGTFPGTTQSAAGLKVFNPATQVS